MNRNLLVALAILVVCLALGGFHTARSSFVRESVHYIMHSLLHH